MRTKRARATLFRCIAAGADRFGFRIIEFSIQSNHLHMIVEADDARCLAQGLQALKVRMARALKNLWRLTGPRFKDRYHARVLETLREVRNALHYVLNNARRHGHPVHGSDPFSSGPSFRGWRRPTHAEAPPPDPPTPRPRLLPARCWKLTTGWLRHGRLCPHTTPG